MCFKIFAACCLAIGCTGFAPTSFLQTTPPQVCLPRHCHRRSHRLSHRTKTSIVSTTQSRALNLNGHSSVNDYFDSFGTNDNPHPPALSLRTRLLKHGAKSYGPLILSGSETVAELLAGIGYSHIVVDMEHSPVDVSQTTSLLRAIDSASRGGASVSNFPVVRAPGNSDVAMTKRILDVLRPPAGIMFPMIENAAQAEMAVAGTRYPTDGVRGCAHPFVRASQYGRNSDYFDVDSRDILTIVQVESEEAIENIPSIGMVDGVDVIFLGPFDISCSIGHMGEFEEHSKPMQLIRHAEQLVRDADMRKRQSGGTGLILGGFRSPGRSLEEMFSDEVRYQFVCGSVDLGLLGAAALADFAAGKDAMQ